ncbi:MAG TPA: hypothetical protein VFJ58_15375, partial [Armatimonadota bacterium]|nr:hypothetical protein [Armatimonadota bacterium]
LWARTVPCQQCRAAIPLLKTLWLCKKEKKRVLLKLQPNADRTAVDFAIESGVPEGGKNASQRREHDKQIGQGTMHRKGAWCPCCGKPGTVSMTMSDIRREAMAGHLGAVMTAVVVQRTVPRPSGRGMMEVKAYRLPTDGERCLAEEAKDHLKELFAGIPFGLPEEPTPTPGIGASRAFSVPLYGFDRWYKLFTPRQLLSLGTFVKYTREARSAQKPEGYPANWMEAIGAYLAIGVDRLSDRNSSVQAWDNTSECMGHTFTRFAFPVVWDFGEPNAISDTLGSYAGAIDWIARYISESLEANSRASGVEVVNRSVIADCGGPYDVILTDPPYYDAIPYSDLMDFFYVWLRRTLAGLSPGIDAAMTAELAPKWDHETSDGELIDDASRFGNDREKSKSAYEEGMFRAFKSCWESLASEGRLVIVFASKQPDAWETLVSAIIRAGFVVDASWPIQTEMGNRLRATASAALSSSIWLVCRKRPPTARPGWDTRMLEEMRSNISDRLRDFWDAGIRGPDFVWVATGPALEAYSKYPAVKKTNDPGEELKVGEFLKQVRRLVVEFAVSRLLSPEGGDAGDAAELDDVTTYYLLHRNSFGLGDAPSGACILYAVSCGLSERDLADRLDILSRSGGMAAAHEEDDGDDNDIDDEPEPVEEGTGSAMRLKSWRQRNRPGMGFEPSSDVRTGRRARRPDPDPVLAGLEDDPGAKQIASLLPDPAPGRVFRNAPPLIDQVHRLMHLWQASDQAAVDRYISDRGIRRSALFPRLLQALIELAGRDSRDSEEHTLLQRISNQIKPVGPSTPPTQLPLLDTEPPEEQAPGTEREAPGTGSEALSIHPSSLILHPSPPVLRPSSSVRAPRPAPDTRIEVAHA